MNEYAEAVIALQESEISELNQKNESLEAEKVALLARIETLENELWEYKHNRG